MNLIGFSRNNEALLVLEPVMSDLDGLVQDCSNSIANTSQIAKFMGLTWGPHGACRPQMGPMLAPWTLLLGMGVTVLH